MPQGEGRCVSYSFFSFLGRLVCVHTFNTPVVTSAAVDQQWQSANRWKLMTPFVIIESTLLSYDNNNIGMRKAS
ncbi:unnamed protein product [Ceratitis capitata]|uniref:(Mediterranean fruit fly) hypothetical protein n=1 Tax=Ceratitis capitata TaxID=7213 RepID=A0A811VHW6_CERCA|nr:unnamed protein product [Ceratitis capitata]